LIYGFTGITNFGDLAKLLNNILILKNEFWWIGISIGSVFILIGLFFKLTIAPFHMWGPDVYEGAPTIVTAFFAIVPKIAFFTLLIRLFLYSFYDFLAILSYVILICSVVSMFISATTGLSQVKIKRLLAFSSIGQVGYMLIGIVVGTLDSLQNFFLYLIIYCIMSLGIFGFILLINYQNKKKLKTYRIKYLTELSNLNQLNITLTFLFAIIIFSMIGIPPLAGFLSKFYIFTSAVKTSFYFFAILGILISIIGAFYYIRLIKIVYFDNLVEISSIGNLERENTIVLISSCFFVILFLIYPRPLLLFVYNIGLVFSI